MKRVPALFFRTAAGGEPVREWLKALDPIEDRKRIGLDINTVEFGWPIGMPACRPLKDGSYEVRTNLAHGRIERVLFYIDAESRMVLLHGFIKKTRRTPDEDLELARKNKRLHEVEMRTKRRPKRRGKNPFIPARPSRAFSKRRGYATRWKARPSNGCLRGSSSRR